jgi:hypothetical protein
MLQTGHPEQMEQVLNMEYILKDKAAQIIITNWGLPGQLLVL